MKYFNEISERKPFNVTLVYLIEISNEKLFTLVLVWFNPIISWNISLIKNYFMADFVPDGWEDIGTISPLW